ncbi:retrovirus-related pol polyprotein from transposon TNT 1-94 [Tanacetum coccineum]|uniref:Retrovirus-related pol polyprotein from transposon TNT 1-94 n=1 Tax=Tanacetum coccineum TaxID=301880 RepID=A0ABQ4YK94_9ASTR
MSTSNTHQQSLVDAGSETRPPMLERGSYIPWASRFRRYLNRKRENRKWINKVINEGPYEFRIFTPSETEEPMMQKEKDLRGDDLKHYEAEIEAMNLILISIPNDIYNYVDACTTAKSITGVSLQSFAQLINDLERNVNIFPKVTINTKFLNRLQPKWLKYVTRVRLAKRLTEDSYDDLFDYLQQSKKLVNASRAKKHPSLVVDYDDDYLGDTIKNNFEDPLTSAMILLAYVITHSFSNPTNNRLRTSSNAKNQAIVQGDIVNIQSKHSRNDGRNIRRSYVQEEIIEGNVQCYNCSEKGHYARNCPKPIMEEIEELSANICLMARIQPVNFDSNEGTSYGSAFLSEVQTPSTSYVNPLFAKDA